MTSEPDEPSASRAHAEFLREYLTERDAPCPGCAYNLRNLASQHCPECGQAVQLSLRLVEPKQGALIVGLIGLAAGAGFGGLLLLYLGIMAAAAGISDPGMLRFAILTGIGFLVHGGAVLTWVRNWNRIRTAPAVVRRLLLVTCWAMPLIFVAVFAYYIR